MMLWDGVHVIINSKKIVDEYNNLYPSEDEKERNNNDAEIQIRNKNAY